MANVTSSECLAFFGCQCCGIKFYQWDEAGSDVIRPLRFKREADNPHDVNCIAVLAESGWTLGHVAKEAAGWLSPLLLGPYRIRG